MPTGFECFGGNLSEKGCYRTLKRNHDYYYQVLAQMACTGIEWCDFSLWCEYDDQLETMLFNEDMWTSVITKVSNFFFNHFI